MKLLWELSVFFWTLSNAECSDNKYELPLEVDEEYQKRIRANKQISLPRNADGQPVAVLVGFYLESISNINPINMEFDVDIFLRMTWYDSRLVHNNSQHYSLTDSELIRQIWRPDLYLANSKSAQFQDVTMPNRIFIIYPDGYVYFSVRIVAKIACNLNLRHYPLDTQSCYIKFTSYANPTSQLTLDWLNNPIAYNEDIELPEMSLLSVSNDSCPRTFKDFSYGQTPTSSLVGSWSCLLAVIKLKRNIGYHLVQTYIPTFLIVLISWLSFWIDPTAIPARISLSFTTLLTLSTMSNGIRMSLPAVSYAKALDYWVGMCTIFVFAALLEFALVNTIVRRAAVRRARLSACTGNVQLALAGNLAAVANPLLAYSGSNALPTYVNDKHRNNDDDDDETSKSISSTQLLDEANNFSRWAKRMDKVSRILFPLCFLLFNLVYWGIYLSDEEK